MGFFDKLKAVKNMVTGGAAEVVASIEHDGELSVGEPFNIKVQALTKDADLKIGKVYLKLRAVEHIEAEGIEVEYEGGEREVEHEIVKKTVETYNHEILVDGPQTMEANETYEWNVEVTIPEKCNGTYNGVHAEHRWMFFVGLDAFGNDPDSGWIPFDIY
ncbi:hypothetical protein V6R21_17360 [Limibacter armeniacum]|uniref:hypothetical protein n=1 Tax=Limibacter armeniacum TaxID=466084 RepID=UPI002FE6A7FB